MKKRIIWLLIVVFALMNAIAYVHAYKFTHFSTGSVPRTKDPKDLSTVEKVKLLFTGIDNPKPKAKRTPARRYETIGVQSSEWLECWIMKTTNAKGTVILFHGYTGEKSMLLERADKFIDLGYNVMLVDFQGSGNSGGSTTTIGFSEADQVVDCFNYVREKGEKNIVLFGTSMGAAAILKAMRDFSPDASALILECPFGTLYETVKARFEVMDVPAFPMASLLCFWGGAQNGYWAFSHNPADYAKTVTIPTLLLYGMLDNRVSEKETDDIFNNLQGTRVVKKYPNQGHEVFSTGNRTAWEKDVKDFLQNFPSSY